MALKDVYSLVLKYSIFYFIILIIFFTLVSVFI